MSKDALPSRSFRRRLLHHRGDEVARLLASLPDDAIEPLEYSPSALLLDPAEVGVLLLDRALHREIALPPPEGLGEAAERLGVVVIGERSGEADPFWPPRVYFSLPEEAPDHHLARAIRSVFRFLEERTAAAAARRGLADRNRDIENLNRIGISLAAETDPRALVTQFLARARDLTHADAGSLYLIERGDDGAPYLRFKAAQNDSVKLHFEEIALPLDSGSIAGRVATTGEVLRVADVYHLPPEAPYHFNRQSDVEIRYRTQSMLAVPMKNVDGRVLGVLQLMNRKRHVVPDLTTTAVMRRETVEFDADNEEIARSLAAQAAVALENARLTEHLRNLFDGFVAASVTAIEQRDPTTSGHSQRVAVFTCALAQATDRADSGPYTAFRISRGELTALRYAAVLHDFGKVGVREAVLVKARKLPPGRIDFLRERFERARLASAVALWQCAAGGEISVEAARSKIAEQRAELDAAWQEVLGADVPSVLDRPVPVSLSRVESLEFCAEGGETERVLPVEDARYLSIPRGTLNEMERREIESHVTQTQRFLSRIPWTPELSRVPELASLHHEKLDGSGYPRGLKSDEIPPPARMMTICDIFDALSASDRPYKRAVPREDALDILRSDAKRGALDSDLLDIFVQARVYEAVVKPDPGTAR
jgi:HD-GYP domain-containing protein (c-di-GMP phosphodiesterase class II)